MSSSTILATIPDEIRGSVRHINIVRYEKMLAENPPDKAAIAEMVYHRFHGRYIKPFLFDDKRYKKFYKHGFSIMASSCLLIEALESFEKGLEETPKERGAGERVFETFFEREAAFKKFKGKGFYKNVRCGILHQGETTRGFTIERTGDLFDGRKRINAQRFLNALEESLGAYKKRLVNAEWDSEIWDNLRRKMRFIIAHCNG